MRTLKYFFFVIISCKWSLSVKVSNLRQHLNHVLEISIGENMYLHETSGFLPIVCWREREPTRLYFLCEYIVFFSVQSPVSQSSLHISAPLWLHFSFYSYVLLNKKHSYRTPYFIWKVSVYLVFLFLGGRGDNGSPIIVFPEFPAFGEITDKEFHNVLTYLTSVPR